MSLRPQDNGLVQYFCPFPHDHISTKLAQSYPSKIDRLYEGQLQAQLMSRVYLLHRPHDPDVHGSAKFLLLSRQAL